MSEPLQGAALLAAAVRTATMPPALLGPNTRAEISSVSTDSGGLVSVEVTGIPGMAASLVIDVADCSSWFQAEVAALGAGADGIVGRQLQISFQSGQDGTTQYTACFTVGR